MVLAPIAVHGAAMAAILSRPRWRATWVMGIVAAVFVVLASVAAFAGFFDADPVHVFPAQGAKRPVGVLYLSGDMGLRFGPNPDTVRALARQGIAVVGLNMPTLFRTRRTRGAVDAIVADGVRQALARPRLGWTPLTCIHGVDEVDSACPDVRLPNATVVALPGGHFLRDDHAGLFVQVIAAVRRAAPEAFR